MQQTKNNINTKDANGHTKLTSLIYEIVVANANRSHADCATWEGVNDTYIFHNNYGYYCSRFPINNIRLPSDLYYYDKITELIFAGEEVDVIVPINSKDFPLAWRSPFLEHPYTVISLIEQFYKLSNGLVKEAYGHLLRFIRKKLAERAEARVRGLTEFVPSMPTELVVLTMSYLFDQKIKSLSKK